MADEKKEKKGLLDKALDALTTRDEKKAAEEASDEAKKAKAEAARAEAQRQIAEARAEAAERKAKEAEEKIKEAEEAERVAAAREHARKVREELDAKRAAAEEAAQQVYVVKSGDSLSKIAKEQLGDASRWPEIFELNKDKIKDPNLIYPNQELKMPKK